ncbi:MULTISPECIES: DUF1007 family protein [unclassified Rhizobium]|uniref:DUF1007 family protein n=1 Tax=Rhizobium/Agrobacterium group TaxID=227290 RepID=UPI001AE35F91|nr:MULTISPECIES: DUF1007 family protein [unclassified Rhizobium]MBP2462260.1 ABC-type uncharacterized transport system substrate-binding protein [Rhizobium sp. PvP014]MBP2529655.1 ABC-type uncharacterized transport system substrate-binding protein [Rhizobium sp. PvP099]
MRNRLATILTAAALAAPLAVPAPALAHPHIFAEARLEIVAGADGTVQELRNVWRFDEVFSSSVILDFDKNGDLKLDPHELAELGETIRTSLADYHYFSTVTLDGAQIGIKKPDVFHTTMQDKQLMLIFAVKPEKPVPLKGKLTFGIYDPTMYTAIDFPTDKDLVLKGAAFEKCQHKVVRPDPDDVISQNSASLTDAFFNDPTGTDMTKLFATRMEVTC